MLAYIDCFSGISGDMLVGALLDLGVSIDDLKSELKKMALRDFSAGAEKIVRQGISATDFSVRISMKGNKDHHHGHDHRHNSRGLVEILDLLEKSRLPKRVKERSARAFRLLAVAEGKVHGCSPEKVHFHEVGAVDAIVDVVSAMICFEQLDVDSAYHRIVPVSRGTAESAHGKIPLPAPAVLELLKNCASGVEWTTREGEIATPTGLAILHGICEKCGDAPPFSVEGVGYGAGDHQYDNPPNLLRVVLGKELKNPAADRVLVLETNLDNCTPEVLGYLFEKLLRAGALDVFTTPVAMKKNRPATLLTVLCEPHLGPVLQDLIFRETPTMGMRCREERRVCLEREFVKVKTPYGLIPVKVGKWMGKRITFSPEYEDCRAAAEKSGHPLAEIYLLAKTLALQTTKE